jgi:hypothetical protein
MKLWTELNTTDKCTTGAALIAFVVWIALELTKVAV